MPCSKIKLLNSLIRSSGVLLVQQIAHGLRGCVEENWQVEGFTVLKIDLVNAFNLVSHQALLAECSTHFPELLLWVS